jgi:Lrp/AsnC family leucine-responsive transcriptional regulator
MDLNLEKLLDSTGRKILTALQENARLSLSELGRRVGLTQPAAAERVKRLEESGVISGYHAEIDPTKLGWPILAFVRLNTPAEKYPRFLKAAADWPEIMECHHVSGGDSFVLKVIASSMVHLEELIGRLSPYGGTTTTIVLSSPIKRKIIP